MGLPSAWSVSNVTWRVGLTDSKPLIASAAIRLPLASKSKPSTRPPVLTNTSWSLPSGCMRKMLPLATVV